MASVGTARPASATRRPRRLAAVGLLVVLAGCVRAGTLRTASIGEPVAAKVAPSKPTAEAPPSPDTIDSCPPTQGQMVLEDVNRIRADAGLRPLTVDLRLVAAARAQARDIAEGAPVGHVGLDGSLPEHRVRRAGYEWSKVGENVAAGIPTATEVVAGWMRSEHHRANILGGGFTNIGIAFLDMRSSAYGTYWVQVFAAPLDPKAAGRPARCNP